MQLGVIGEIQRVIFLRVVAFKGHEQHIVAAALAHGDTLLHHGLGQLCLNLRHLILYVDCGLVHVRSVLERNRQAIRSVVARSGRHIHHSLHAVYLLFHRNADGLGHRSGRRAGIVGHDHNGRRRDVGILCDRQGVHAQQTGQHHQYGYDRGEYRPLYEEITEHGSPRFILPVLCFASRPAPQDAPSRRCARSAMPGSRSGRPA